MNKRWILTGVCLWANLALAQLPGTGGAQASEFTIPASPAFDLLAINPAQITRPNTIKDFKVDWSFRSWRLKPNLAIQAQPVWEIFYNRPNLSRYRNASAFMRTLSTLDISAGTIEDDILQRRASAAVKINLYRQYDPLREARLFEAIDTSYQRISGERALLIGQIKRQIRETPDEGNVKALLIQKLDSVMLVQGIDARAHKEKTQVIAGEYVKSFWNASHVDVAWGRVFSFENEALDSLVLRGRSSALWVTASKGIGRKFLLTGIAKYLSTRSSDSLGQRGSVFTSGMGIRYGSPRFNFFSEFVFSRPSSAGLLNNPELNLTQLQRFSMSYGGDWRINPNVLLSYGVRIDYAENLRFKNILPVAGVSCMMR